MTIAKRKRTLAELLAESGETEYPKQYEYIASLLQSGKVIPVKHAPLNGRRPALCTAFWEIEEEPVDKEKLKEEQGILILENKDTFYTMSRFLIEGGRFIFSEEIREEQRASEHKLEEALKEGSGA